MTGQLRMPSGKHQMASVDKHGMDSVDKHRMASVDKHRMASVDWRPIFTGLHKAYTGTVLVLSKLKKNKRNRTAIATQRFKVFCDI